MYKTLNVKNQLIMLFMVLVQIVTSAQQKSETFYSDKLLSKEVNNNKGRFKKVETSYENGIVNVKIFDIKKNCLINEQNYKDKKPYGVWLTYSEECSLTEKRDFSKITYLERPIDTLFNNEIKEGNPNKYEKAQFGNDIMELYQYIDDNLNFPKELVYAGISGKVYLQIIIKIDGTSEIIAITKGAHPLLDYESWKVATNIPDKWTPAKKDGQPINSYYILPIGFNIF